MHGSTNNNSFQSAVFFIYYDFVIAKQTLFNRNCNLNSCIIFDVTFILQFSHNFELSGIAYRLFYFEYKDFQYFVLERN